MRQPTLLQSFAFVFALAYHASAVKISIGPGHTECLGETVEADHFAVSIHWSSHPENFTSFPLIA